MDNTDHESKRAQIKRLQTIHDELWTRGSELYAQVEDIGKQVVQVRKEIEDLDPDYDPIHLLFNGTFGDLDGD
jgi:hypothetical protein